MMESALAAAVLKLESHIPDKQGGKGNKAEADGKKAAFADALKQHHPGKANRPAKEPDAQAQEPLADIDALAVAPTQDPPETVTEIARPQTQAPLRLKKTIDFLAAHAPQSEGAADDVAAGAQETKLPRGRAESKLAEAKLGAVRHVLREAVPPTEAADAEAMPDVAELPDAGEVAAPQKRLTPKRPSAPEDDVPAEKPVGNDISARHALGMLDERSARLDSRPAAQAPQDALEASPGQDEGTAPVGGYRISRADGKGGVLDIPGRMAGEVHEKQPVTNFSQIIVLDQRRYLAPAQDNALQVIQSLTAEPEWVSAMQPDQSLANAAVVAGGGKVVNTLKIQMHPIELGLVNATLRLHGEELSVELKVETGAAYRQLKDDHNRMIDALKAQGFSVDKITIVMAPERTDPGAGAGSQAGGQPSGGQGAGFAQQQARDGGQGSGMGQERRNFGQERASNGGVNADEHRTEGVGSPVAGSGRPGHVYL